MGDAIWFIEMLNGMVPYRFIIINMISRHKQSHNRQFT